MQIIDKGKKYIVLNGSELETLWKDEPLEIFINDELFACTVILCTTECLEKESEK